jgi:predicted Ser/Thr protein kinase
MSRPDQPTRRERPTPSGTGCPDADALAAFADGTLAADERPAIEAHIDGCPSCREVVGHVGATAPAPAPRMIDRYRLDRELGRGGMGVVWKAWDPALERTVAVKLLHPELDDDLWRARALREARALARLQHANVIAVHDVGEVDGEVFIATEFIDGESLDQWQKGKAPAEIVAAYAQAARGLAAAHALGLVHRDIKPSNILVARDGRVCVGDFGLAISEQRKSDASVNRGPRPPPTATVDPRRPLPKLTEAGEVVGTPAYMAPEQLTGGDVDARADQYALCLALAEALLGRDLPEPPTPEALAGASEGAAAPWAAIARGLELAREDRFPTMAPLVEALSAPIAAAAPARGSRTAAIAAIAGVAVLGGGVAAWRLLRSEPTGVPPPPPVIAAPGTGASPGSGSAEPRPAPLPAPWVASMTGPYRLPFAGDQIRLVDERRALVLPERRSLGVFPLDLDTGAVGAAISIGGTGDDPEVLARVGDRIIAFGHHPDKTPAAWAVTLDPPAATEIPIPDGGKPLAKGSYRVVAVSPDGTKLVVCGRTRPPLVRDARTFAVLRVLPATACANLRFSAANKIVTDNTEIDVGTGKQRVLGDSEYGGYAGPGGHTAAGPDDNGTSTVRRDGVVTQASFPVDETLRWTPDGVAITWVAGSVSLRPGPGGAPRLVPTKLGLAASNVFDLDVDATHFALLRGAIVEVVDLESGTDRTATGNLALVYVVAPRGGTVLAAADELRVWHGDTVLATVPEDSVYELAPLPVPGPVYVNSGASDLARWDPDTGVWRRVGELDGLGNPHVVAHGEDVWFADGTTIKRLRGDASPAPWITFAAPYELEALDPIGERMILTSETRLVYVDLRAKTALAWTIVENCRGLTVALAANAPWIGVEGTDKVRGTWAVELLAGAQPIRIETATDRLWGTEVAARSDGELVLASRNTIVLWRPRATTGVVWTAAAPATIIPWSLALDAAGSELAVGYDTGGVAWARLDDVRATGTTAPMDLFPDDATCLVGPGSDLPFASLGVVRVP